MANLNSLTTQINELRSARADALAEILSTSTRYLELSAKLERGDIDEKEAEDIFMECANNGDWEEDYDNLEFGDPESDIEEIKDE